jgi:hypothetical protein
MGCGCLVGLTFGALTGLQAAVIVLLALMVVSLSLIPRTAARTNAPGWPAFREHFWRPSAVVARPAARVVIKAGRA